MAGMAGSGKYLTVAGKPGRYSQIIPANSDLRLVRAAEVAVPDDGEVPLSAGVLNVARRA